MEHVQPHGAPARESRRAAVGPRTRLAAISVAMVLGASLGSASVSAAPMRPAASAHHLDEPDAIAAYGSHLFVANRASNSVSELRASGGSFVALISGGRFRINKPSALLVVGKYLFVANEGNDTVTVISAVTGKLVRVISGSRYHLAGPSGLAQDASGHLFILGMHGSVTEVGASTGRLVATATGGGFGFDGPSAIAVAYGHVFVTNASGNTVSELRTSNLSLVSVLSSATYQFDQPTGAVAHGPDVWISNWENQTVTELAAASGALVQVIPNLDNYLPTPGPIAYGDGYVFVASPPGGSPMVTQVIASDPPSEPWMMCNTNGPYTFNNPSAMLVTGATLWVVNSGGGTDAPDGASVTEMHADSGALIRVLR